ncbi:MAG: AbrB/MazE/SpoVT family DNA-binding domain-containing protein [Chloroflexota bacterium]
MERLQQLVNGNGLQIPLPFITQYGLHPGSEVMVELDDDVIRIVPKYPDQATIEKTALKLLLNSLGDAVLIKAKQLETNDLEEDDGRKVGDWRVAIHVREIEEPLGYIDYAKNGELLSDLETTLDAIRQKVGTLVSTV